MGGGGEYKIMAKFWDFQKFREFKIYFFMSDPFTYYIFQVNVNNLKKRQNFVMKKINDNVVIIICSSNNLMFEVIFFFITNI